MKIPDSTVSGSKPLRDPRLTAINFVSDAVNRTLDLKEIADNALDSVLAVMKVDAGAVYIWQDIDHALHLFAWRGLSEDVCAQGRGAAEGHGDHRRRAQWGGPCH